MPLKSLTYLKKLKPQLSAPETGNKAQSLLFLKNVPVNWDEEINHHVINHFLDHLGKK